MQLGGKLLKVHYPKLAVMRRVEHTVSLFFNDFSKISILNQIISAHKMIYNIFGSGIYHKPHSIFKSKYQELHNRNIGLCSGNEAIMAGYFMGMQRDLRMRKVLQATILSAEFISIPTNTKFTKAVKYFMIISHYKDVVYLSRLFFLAFEFFAWHIVILQEWKKFITIRE